MTSIFPSTLTSYTNPNATDRLNSPSHSGIEQNQNSGVSQVEKVIGVAGANSVIGTFEYDVRSPASNGGGHIQTAAKGGTGQTIFTKGDILIASSPTTLSKLAVGGNGQALVADSTQATGVRWGISSIQTFASPSTLVWTKSSPLSTYAIVTAIGAGGSGACGNGSNAGGGGSGGGFSQQLIPIGGFSSVLVTIGSGGAAQAAFNSNGFQGGNTTFGNIVIVQGGPGGNAGGTSPAGGSVAGIFSVFGVQGGKGGASASHDLGGPGGGAGAGNAVSSIGGAFNTLNGRGGAVVNGASGNPGSVYGGGGAGCPETFTSGAGAGGYLSIAEY